MVPLRKSKSRELWRISSDTTGKRRGKSRLTRIVSTKRKQRKRKGIMSKWNLKMTVTKKRGRNKATREGHKVVRVHHVVTIRKANNGISISRDLAQSRSTNTTARRKVIKKHTKRLEWGRRKKGN